MFTSSWVWFLLLLVNIACIVHVIKRNREFWWIFVIILFQGIGALVYFLVEMLPDIRRDETQKSLKHLQQGLMSNEAKIKKLKRELASTPTIEKKVELGDTLGMAGRWNEAAEIYKECAGAPFDDDPFILYAYAHALFQTQEYEKSETVLNKINATKSRDKLDARKLLHLRILEHTGREKKALDSYPELLETFSGEEARFRYASLLIKLGKSEEARHQFKKIAGESELHSKLYKRQNRQWITEAKKQLSRIS